ncbi:MAG: hypothetical protein ABIC40_00175 [bacterium]
MTASHKKNAPKDERYSIVRTLGFAALLISWWILTFEIPGKNLFRIAAQTGVSRKLAPITLWAFEFTQRALTARSWAIFFFILAIFLHSILWHKRVNWDVWGRWLFKTGFFVLYLFMYALFLIIFVAVEFPLWTMPKTN